jgi:phospholipid/cholesterol/gamma-HCH transport system ATP-binding protein
MIEKQTVALETKSSISKNKVVEVKHLKKQFGDRKVLNDVSLDVYECENLVVLGRSGSGKSVLIKCMVGLLKPDSGEVQVLGYDVPSLSPRN